MCARDKINAISLNIKINKRKSVHIRGYKLPINVQNIMQKDSAQAKISLKVVGGGATFFNSPCRDHQGCFLTTGALHVYIDQVCCSSSTDAA